MLFQKNHVGLSSGLITMILTPDIRKMYSSALIFSAVYAIYQLLVYYASGISHCSIQADSPSYYALTDALANGSFLNVASSTVRTPGYPLLILLSSLAGNYAIDFLIVFQIVLSAFALFAFCLLIHQTTKSSLIAFMGALLFVLHLHQSLLNMIVYTESVFISLLILASFVYNLWLQNQSSKYWLVFAFIMNFALLVRPVLLFFILAFLLIMLIKLFRDRKFLKPFIVFAAFFILISGSWMARNYYCSGSFSYTFVSKINMGIIRKGMLEGKMKYPDLNYTAFNNHPALDDATLFYVNKYNGFKSMGEKEQGDILLREAWHCILANPWAYAKLHAAGMLHFTYASEQFLLNTILDSQNAGRNSIRADFNASMADANFGESMRIVGVAILVIWNILSVPYNLLLWIAMLLCVLFFWRKLSKIHWFSVALIAYFWLISGPEIFVAPRLRMPAEPFIVFLVVSGLALYTSTRKSRGLDSKRADVRD